MKDSNFLKDRNARNIWHPMAHPGDMQANPPTIITQAQGTRITDIDGHEVVDAVGGLWNVNLGFSATSIKKAIADQLDRLPYYSAFKGTTNDVIIELSEVLHDFFAPDGLARAFYTSGGGDSVETSLRLARQYHKIKGDEGRTKFLRLKTGYHGTQFGGASVNGNVLFRNIYEPLLPGCYHIPAPYAYRNPFNETDPERLAQLCLQALEDEIAFQGPNTIAAMIMEPVLGAGGVLVPHETFMPGVREITAKHGILISDEVITGFGRTGDWTGARHWGVQPDMATTAKAITNGYFPFGAVMISEAVAEVFEKDETGKATIGHGYTYSGHPVGAAAALACLDETIKLQVQKNAKTRGDELFAGLQALKDRHEIIGDVRGGHGLMLGIELVQDRDSKTPIQPEIAAKIHQTTYENGAMVRSSGANILMSPPLVLTSDDVQVILNALESGFSTL